MDSGLRGLRLVGLRTAQRWLCRGGDGRYHAERQSILRGSLGSHRLRQSVLTTRDPAPKTWLDLGRQNFHDGSAKGSFSSVPSTPESAGGDGMVGLLRGSLSGVNLHPNRYPYEDAIPQSQSVPVVAPKHCPQSRLHPRRAARRYCDHRRPHRTSPASGAEGSRVRSKDELREQPQTDLYGPASQFAKCFEMVIPWPRAYASR